MLPLQHKILASDLAREQPQRCEIEALWEGVKLANIRISSKMLGSELELEVGMLQTHIDGGPQGARPTTMWAMDYRAAGTIGCATIQ